MVLGAACLLLQGEQLMERLYIPRLRVKKHWYVGLNPDPIDHSHPDVGKADAAAQDLLDHAAHAAQAAHQQHAAYTHGGHTAAHAPQHTPPQPPPPPQQQQPAHASIPTQPLAQAQQQQQPQTGGHAPALPQPPPPQATHPQPAQQQPTQQPAQQPTNPPAQQQQQPPKDMSAVLKVKERIDNYAKQFGQVRVCVWTHEAKQQLRQAHQKVVCMCAPWPLDKDSSRQDTTLSREDWADPLQPAASSDSKHTHLQQDRCIPLAPTTVGISPWWSGCTLLIRCAATAHGHHTHVCRRLPKRSWTPCGTSTSPCLRQSQP